MLLGENPSDELLKSSSRFGSMHLAVSLKGEKVWKRPLSVSLGARRTTAEEDEAAVVGRCSNCNIYEGHLTTCPNFRRLGGNKLARPPPPSAGRHRVAAVAARETIRDVYQGLGDLEGPRSLLTHAVLCGATEEFLLKLNAFGASTEAAGELCYFAEAVAWRGVSSTTAARLLLRVPSTPMPHSRLTGYSPVIMFNVSTQKEAANVCVCVSGFFFS